MLSKFYIGIRHMKIFVTYLVAVSLSIFYTRIFWKMFKTIFMLIYVTWFCMMLVTWFVTRNLMGLVTICGLILFKERRSYRGSQPSFCSLAGFLTQQMDDTNRLMGIRTMDGKDHIRHKQKLILQQGHRKVWSLHTLPQWLKWYGPFP